MSESIHSDARNTVRGSARGFEQSPFRHLWETPETVMGVYAGRFYPTLNGEDIEACYWTLRRKAMLYDVPERPVEISGPDAVAFLERIFTRPIGNLKPGRGRYAIACTHHGGLFMDGVLFRLDDTRFNTQPRVGDGVYLAEGGALSNSIKDALEGDVKGDRAPLLVELGHLSGLDDAALSIPPEKLFGRHCGVFGATGGGKSWTVSRLVNEIVRIGGKCILFDPTGEFAGKVAGAKQLAFSPIDETGAEQVHFPHKNLSEIDLYSLLTPSPQVQGPTLRSAIKSLRLAKALLAGRGGYTYEEDNGRKKFDIGGKGFVEVLANGTIRKAGNSRHALSVAQITLADEINSDLCDFDLSMLAEQIRYECVKQGSNSDHGVLGNFGKPDDFALGACNHLNVRIETYLGAPELACMFKADGQDIATVIEEFIVDGAQRALVISFRDVSFKYNARELLLNTLGRHLLEMARGNKFVENPLVCVLDEAHQFIGRSIGDEHNHVTLDAFGFIAKEGRKYGLTTVIATQRPRDVPQDVLSQLGTLFVHRLTNDRDRETIERACGDLDRSAAAFIPSLSQGEAIIVGPDLPAPLPIMMSKPEKGQQPESHGPKYQDFWGVQPATE